jgi:hypothetical protein
VAADLGFVAMCAVLAFVALARATAHVAPLAVSVPADVVVLLDAARKPHAPTAARVLLVVVAVEAVVVAAAARERRSQARVRAIDEHLARQESERVENHGVNVIKTAVDET